MTNNNQYFKFWVHDDNFKALSNIPAGSRGTLVNEAMRHYFDTLTSNSAGVSATMDAIGDGPAATVRASGLNAYNLNTPQSYIMSTHGSPVCPNGHLWMNGTNRCVNRKCMFGKIQK